MILMTKLTHAFVEQTAVLFVEGAEKISQKAIKLRGNVDRKQVKKIKNGGEIIWL